MPGYSGKKAILGLIIVSSRCVATKKLLYQYKILCKLFNLRNIHVYIYNMDFAVSHSFTLKPGTCKNVKSKTFSLQK